MAGVNPHEAKRFYEEDEDPARIFALFDAGQKSQTQRPGRPGLAPRPGKLAGIRQRVAVVLRRAADMVEPPSKAPPRQRRTAHRPH
jgi:hypothetical protein